MRAAIVACAVAALAISAGACGDDSSSDANEPAGKYTVEVVSAEFPARQVLGQTSLLRLGIRNTGRKTVPALAVSISIAGREGQASTLPFGIRDPQPELAQPDRPVWVLALRYPKFAGSSEPGGAGTSNPKTFAFGELKPGATANVVWKLSAVRTGRYVLRFVVDAGFGGQAKAVTAGGSEPGGSIGARIVSATPDKVVTDSGEVVEK
ncbi:MAG TPA: hypothetical protein VIS51_05370 [Solirubrobacterales bacterium]